MLKVGSEIVGLTRLILTNSSTSELALPSAVPLRNDACLVQRPQSGLHNFYPQ